MKWNLIVIMLGAILWATVVSDAVPAFLNHHLFARAIANKPQAEYALNYVPTPAWWPH
ncbi:MAG: hypothetical protein PHW60_00725 [Kiritimatiellae bacterium]|nr:hypothetical protein [Kiritimatiellia bacterium]